MNKRLEIPENCKVDLLQGENNIREFEFTPPGGQGRYILGCDPFMKITKWHRFWMFFGLYRGIRSGCITLVFDKKGLKYALK